MREITIGNKKKNLIITPGAEAVLTSSDLHYGLTFHICRRKFRMGGLLKVASEPSRQKNS